MPKAAYSSEPIGLALPIDERYPRLRVHARSETISNFIREYGVWQRAVTMFLIRFLKRGDVVVDVGANLGYFSVYAALCVGPGGRVHAIEPDVDNAELLQANVALNDLANVEIHRLAAGGRSGEADLFRGEFNAGAHSLLPKDGLSRGATVRLARLDELLAEEPVPRLVKIDVQGAEVEVLRGMTGLLAQAENHPVIILEFSPLELKRCGQLDELFGFIAGYGYSPRAFIANARSFALPPRLRRSTLRAIADDLLAGKDDAEFDLLLLPRHLREAASKGAAA